MIFLDLDIVTKALRKLGAVFCDVIYTLISKIYELFITVARLNILSSDQIAPIYQRVTMILTIVMTFYITLEFVKYTINPDEFTDKEKGAGNILKRVIIVIALIAFTPTIFKTAYDLQNRIIETNLIPKMILGTTNTDYTSYGNDFSANMLNLFYYYDEDVCGDSGGLNSECDEAKVIVEENLNHIRETGDSDIVNGINLSSAKVSFKEKYPAIKFNGILAIIVGGFILYILVLYSIDVGVRYAQLIFLQIMAPVAIIGYIVPKKDGIFQKWGKQCIVTYLDLFIRIIIINFVLLLVKVLGDAFESGDIFAGIGDVSGSLKVFTYIVLVMGLLLFAQRAPKLLGELLPGMGGGIGFGVNGKGRFEPIGKIFKGAGKAVSGTANTAGRVVGGVAGTIAGVAAGRGLGGKLRGAAVGAKEGARKDNKGLPHRRVERAYAAAVEQRQKEEDIGRRVPPTISTEEAVRQAKYHKERWANVAAEQDRKSKLFELPAGALDSLNGSVDEFKQIKALKQELESAKARGADAALVKTLDAQYKAACQTIRREVVRNNGNLDAINYPVTITYDVLDANGFKTGQQRSIALKLDEGDKNFAGNIDRIASNEIRKIRQAAAEVPEIANTTLKLKVNGQDIEASVNDWINNTVEIDDPANPGQKVKVDVDSRLLYAEFANKFKDAMYDPKRAYEDTAEYAEAHAYKDGIPSGGGGGKK